MALGYPSSCVFDLGASQVMGQGCRAVWRGDAPSHITEHPLSMTPQARDAPTLLVRSRGTPEPVQGPCWMRHSTEAAGCLIPFLCPAEPCKKAPFPMSPHPATEHCFPFPSAAHLCAEPINQLLVLVYSSSSHQQYVCCVLLGVGKLSDIPRSFHWDAEAM